MIANALESMPSGGTIRVTAENISLDSKTPETGLPLSGGRYIKICIRDEGSGIPDEHLPRIFDSYYSTKEMGVQKGMGLDLAIVFSIVNKHNGYITVASEVGAGIEFKLYLPAGDRE